VSAIVAAVGPGLSPATRQWVADATALLRRAGPDGDGVRVHERWGLGHARLDTGADEPIQPITLDGRTWLTADVRLDDAATLRARLGGRGVRIAPSACDAELILHAHAVWGRACVEHLSGEFAFALWDGDRGRLVCARDQLGVGQLVFAEVDGQLIAASAVDALVLHPQLDDELDEDALADALVVGFPTAPTATAYRRARRLAPAHVLISSGRGAHPRRYWRLPACEPLASLARAEDYAARFRELFDAAVAERITGDRVSVHLTGGMDSTSVTATAHAVLAARGAGAASLRAVTCVMGGRSHDREWDYASTVAASLGIEVDVIDGSTLAATDPFAPPLPWTPEPVPYRWTAQDYAMAGVPAAHGPVALTGVAGDALLMFAPDWWLEWLAHGQLGRLARAVGDERRMFGQRPRVWLRHLVYARLRDRPDLSAIAAPDWLDADFAARNHLTERVRARAAAARAGRADVRRLAEDPVWSISFTWGDPAFTGLPVRFRFPFADLRLVGFVRRLPPSPWLVDKRILREAMADRLPDMVRRRPKTPLVREARPGTDPQSLARLRAFVAEAPEVERFIDRAALESRLARFAADPADHALDRELTLPLGVIMWLANRRAPR
jgi:asparagine synthase (glutamine-hydrolysing)